MSEKLKSAIEKITLRYATFHGIDIAPTYVNFFYGNNGMGKTTIARVIDPSDKDVGNPSDLTWLAGRKAGEYDILAYNRKFIRDNFANFRYIPGVFSMGGDNKNIQAEIEQSQDESAKLSKQLAASKSTETNKKSEREAATVAFHKSCYDKGKSYREEFKDALKGSVGSAKAFTEKILAAAAQEIAHSDLSALYQTAYDVNAQEYREFESIDLSKMKSATEYPLLGKYYKQQ